MAPCGSNAAVGAVCGKHGARRADAGAGPAVEVAPAVVSLDLDEQVERAAALMLEAPVVSMPFPHPPVVGLDIVAIPDAVATPGATSMLTG
jgi:hypothetical protein